MKASFELCVNDKFEYLIVFEENTFLFYDILKLTQSCIKAQAQQSLTDFMISRHIAYS